MTDTYDLAKATLTRIGHNYDVDIKRLEQQIKDTIDDFIADLDEQRVREEMGRDS